MSLESIMSFASQLHHNSNLLQTWCPDLTEFSEAGELLPYPLLGLFGQTIAAHFNSMSISERITMFLLVEEGLADLDRDVSNAVATGLLEGLIHKAGSDKPRWEEIEPSLGPRALRFTREYRSFWEGDRS